MYDVFSLSSIRFPEGFLWGSATAGHQIEWSRIEPDQGRYNQKSLAHYLELLGLLQASGIQVFITLHHFTHPLWFDQLGAFSGADNRRYCERYLNFLLPKIAPYTSGWSVMNEFSQWGELSAEPAVAQLKCNMLRAHALRTGELVYPGIDTVFDPEVKGASTTGSSTTTPATWLTADEPIWREPAFNTTL